VAIKEDKEVVEVAVIDPTTIITIIVGIIATNKETTNLTRVP
jgi:hypothetical protein